MFEPSAVASGPSGFSDWPRPFVFRATHLDGQHIRAGAPFYFDLHLFDLNSPAIAYLVLAFAQLAREGLGPARARVELISVSQLDERHHSAALVYDGSSLLVHEPAPPLAMNLAALRDGACGRVTRLRIRFLTPTELKSGHEIAARPEFAILAARIRDRISSLRALYGPGPLEIDFRAFGERAGLVRMTRCDIRQIDVVRRSTRTGQSHSIGGFTGEAEYEGELTEFLPYLRAAEWTGVGRQTVWGKGAIEVECG